MEMCKLLTEEIFFKSAAHRYIYILLYTDGMVRCKLLNITEEMYYSNELATKWKNTIEDTILSNQTFNNSVLKQMALKKLNGLYDNMVKE